VVDNGSWGTINYHPLEQDVNQITEAQA